MGTTYKSTQVTAGSGIPPRALHAGLFAIVGDLNLANPGAALVATDVVQMVKVPKGFTVHDLILDCPDIDSATNLTLSVGDGDSTARYISASAIGQTGGIARLAVAGGTLKQYAAEDTIDILVAAGPATAQAGTIRLTVIGSMDAVPE